MLLPRRPSPGTMPMSIAPKVPRITSPKFGRIGAPSTWTRTICVIAHGSKASENEQRLGRQQFVPGVRARNPELAIALQTVALDETNDNEPPGEEEHHHWSGHVIPVPRIFRAGVQNCHSVQVSRPSAIRLAEISTQSQRTSLMKI